MSGTDLLHKLLPRFRESGVEYVLVGGQVVRLNGSDTGSAKCPAIARHSCTKVSALQLLRRLQDRADHIHRHRK
ncbi:MAG: hypothetical protein ACREVG_14670, partial [Burkholderiales bacterium]